MSEITVTDLIGEELASVFCDKYCKYPSMPIPEGKSEDWLFEDDSPCVTCPFKKEWRLTCE